MSKYVHLKVQTLSGAFEGDFEQGQKLQDVIDKTFLTLDIKPSPGDDYVLKYHDEELEPQQTIVQYKLPDGAVLFLAPDEGGGGIR